MINPDINHVRAFMRNRDPDEFNPLLLNDDQLKVKWEELNSAWAALSKKSVMLDFTKAVDPFAEKNNPETEKLFDTGFAVYQELHIRGLCVNCKSKTSLADIYSTDPRILGEVVVR